MFYIYIDYYPKKGFETLSSTLDNLEVAIVGLSPGFNAVYMVRRYSMAPCWMDPLVQLKSMLLDAGPTEVC